MNYILIDFEGEFVALKGHRQKFKVVLEKSHLNDVKFKFFNFQTSKKR